MRSPAKHAISHCNLVPFRFLINVTESVLVLIDEPRGINPSKMGVSGGSPFRVLSGLL